MSKIGVTYKMSMGNETAENYIEFPIADNHKLLVKHQKPLPKTAYALIENAVKSICTLQGYCFDSIETLELIE